jgi:hypothetical protein
MPRILLADGSTAEVPFLNPGDQLADGRPSVLEAGGVDAGQEPVMFHSQQVENPGSDDNALIAPAASIPTMRRTTIPRFGAPLTRLRNTTRE